MQKKECVCILTSVHTIDDVRVYRKIALSLVKEFEVLWIGPDKYLFDKELNNDGISRILFQNKYGLIGRLRNNIKAIRIYLRQRRNITYVYFPDPDLAFLHTSFFNSKKIKKIYDIHEVYHKDLLDRQVKRNSNIRLRNLIIKAIKRVVDRVDLTIGVSATVLNYYVSEKTPYMIIRSCLPQSFASFKMTSQYKKEYFTIVHGKNHTSRGTLNVLDAFKILKEKEIKCKVLMINQTNLENEVFQSYVDRCNISSHIDLYESLPFKEMLNQMNQCHAGLIAYGRDLGIDSLPNRFFEYLAIGLPVIVPSFSKEMVEIVEKEGCGLLVDTENPYQLAEKIEYMINNPVLAKEMGERGKNAFLKRHNWEAEISPLIDYIKSNT